MCASTTLGNWRGLVAFKSFAALIKSLSSTDAIKIDSVNANEAETLTVVKIAGNVNDLTFRSDLPPLREDRQYCTPATQTAQNTLMINVLNSLSKSSVIL